MGYQKRATAKCKVHGSTLFHVNEAGKPTICASCFKAAWTLDQLNQKRIRDAREAESKPAPVIDRSIPTTAPRKRGPRAKLAA